MDSVPPGTLLMGSEGLFDTGDQIQVVHVQNKCPPCCTCLFDSYFCKSWDLASGHQSSHGDAIYSWDERLSPIITPEVLFQALGIALAVCLSLVTGS